MGDQASERKQGQQHRGGAGDGQIRPLPLGFHTEMPARFFKGDFPIPAQHKVFGNLLRAHRAIGAEKRLGAALAAGMTIHLQERGYAINRKRVQRLMRRMGLEGLAPGPSTSRPAPEHRVYPYLLRDLQIVRPDQVWATDITYVSMPAGFMYLVAIMDRFTRYVLAWELSNTLDTGFCLEALETALSDRRPESFNSDQGVQFTGAAFTWRPEASPSAHQHGRSWPGF